MKSKFQLPKLYNHLNIYQLLHASSLLLFLKKKKSEISCQSAYFICNSLLWDMCVCLKNYYLQSIFHVSYCRSDTTSADLWANLAEQPIWTLPLMNTSAKEMQDAEFRNIPQARVSPTVSKTSQPSFPCQSEVFVHCPSSAWLIWDTLGCNENKLHIWSEPLTTVLHSLVIFLP